MVHAYWAVAGAVLGAAFVLVAGLRGRRRQGRILSAGLAVAALIYVGFGLLSGEPLWLAIELAGAVAFVGIAVAAWRGRPALLSAGWLLHVGWDGLLHLAGPVAGSEWYAALCIGFDVVVAGAVALGMARAVVPVGAAESGEG